MERRIYEVASRVVVISKGFEQNLLAKGVPASKIAVVPNWADASAFVPGARDNAFRQEVGGDGKCVVLYSGGVSINCDLTSVIGAAQQLRQDPVLFVIVGEGTGKEALIRRAKELALSNVVFLPFQPLERYPEVLSAADITLAALSKAATFASVPSKVYKQMAAARPVVAIAEMASELSRLVATSNCGVLVPPGDAGALAAVVRDALVRPGRFEEMGQNGRAYLERECSRTVCVRRLEQIMLEVVKVNGRRKKSGEARA
jgi:colanic acid biosynthesis glycosyl transferase WcaI